MALEGVHRHPAQGRVVRRIRRPAREAVETFRKTYTGLILDHLGKHCALTGIHPLSPGMFVCGPAVTSLGPDLTVRRMAIDLAEPGDVLVVAAGGDPLTACFGDGTAGRMMLKPMAGAVIDGATRDAAGLRRLGFPTFARGATPRNFHYPVAPEYGGVNVPVVCGGVLVSPGDLVVGDDDGVVVVPRDRVEALAPVVLAALHEEQARRAAMTSYEPFGVEDEMRRRGYAFDDGEPAA